MQFGMSYNKQDAADEPESWQPKRLFSSLSAAAVAAAGIAATTGC
jgi:hypothetical protein